MTITYDEKIGSTSTNNEDVAELAVYIRQGQLETAIWKMTELDIDTDWRLGTTPLGRVQGDFQVVFYATR